MTKSYNNERIVQIAHFILENHTTIRATAKAFNIPKSTVHHDLSVKLKYINYPLFKEVKNLLNENDDLSIGGVSQWSPFNYAAYCGQISSLQTLKELIKL